MSPAEPTSQTDEYESLATIKQLTRSAHVTSPAEVPDLTDLDGPTPARSDDPAPDATQAGTKPALRTAATWGSIRPQVAESCSMALRHMGDANIDSIAVTSTGRGEGRTTVAVGLAATAAVELQRRVILLDLDLEHGTIDKVTSLGQGPGVIDYLFEEATVEECLQPLQDGVSVIRAGSPRDRAEVAARMGRLAQLVQELGDRCDVMVADLPPLSSGVITARIADLFHSVTVVVRAGKVAVPNLEKATSVLTQRPFVILNGAEVPKRSKILRLLGLRS